MKAVLCAAALCAVSFSALAGPGEAAMWDTVIPSFERMLGHEPNRMAPPVPAGFPPDPLVAAVREPQWRAVGTAVASLRGGGEAPAAQGMVGVRQRGTWHR